MDTRLEAGIFFNSKIYIRFLTFVFFNTLSIDSIENSTFLYMVRLYKYFPGALSEKPQRCWGFGPKQDGAEGIFGVPKSRQLGCLLSDLVIADRRPQCFYRLKNFFGACRGVSAECISPGSPQFPS